ncbi:MAG TPA: transposase [Clostridia bacterium]|nr:transposase [Clostridia bacterium]
MARQARRHSDTGIYHIMLRGIDKRLIFMDDDDKKKFMAGLEKVKESAYFKLYAYCLMDNHIHLLLEENEALGTIVKRITVGYVQWHNNKYERTGHLFSNRYQSEPVESENYLFTALRYIHQNPVKAGMVKQAEDYPWSSYYDYIKAYNKDDTLVEPGFILDYFGTQDNFVSFMNESNNDECMEYKAVLKYTDTQLRAWIENRYSIEAILALPAISRIKQIIEIYNETGSSIRQLSRVLGMGRSIVGKAVKADR